jgi:shikimate kinase
MDTSRTLPADLALEPGGRHVILVGLPGAGKSTVGSLLARRLRVGFLDFDVEIVRREGMPITEIFATRGEAAFRTIELALTEEVAALPAMVLSPGGGWVTQPQAVAILKPRSRLVYLRISPAGAVRRMGRRMSTRPLLQTPDPRAELEHLLARRREVYETADVVIDVETLDAQRVAEVVRRQLSQLPG